MGFRIGDRVRVLRGFFKGQSATIKNAWNGLGLPDPSMVNIELDNGAGNYGLPTSALELIEPKKTEPLPLPG